MKYYIAFDCCKHLEVWIIKGAGVVNATFRADDLLESRGSMNWRGFRNAKEIDSILGAIAQ